MMGMVETMPMGLILAIYHELRDRKALMKEYAILLNLFRKELKLARRDRNML